MHTNAAFNMLIIRCNFQQFLIVLHIAVYVFIKSKK